jgi:hypothetical protein
MLGLTTLLAVATLTTPPAATVAAPPVILVTIDGVRPREVFRGLDAGPAGQLGPGDAGSPLLPRLLARAAREGFLTGDADRGEPFLVRNLGACSLPGYQSILAGQDTGCLDNRCGRVPVETVLERAVRELGLAAPEVAVFASWPPIALAAERTAGRFTVDAGQAEDPAPWGYRRDRDTWALAMRHLEQFRPRVLYVGLGDADEWAHLADSGAYAASVRDLDARLEELFARLGTMGDYGAGASVLVTTDHGRGDEDWTAHGNGHPGSRHAWLFASTPGTRRAHGRSSRGAHDHLAIRPTIEALLGLEPCTGCQAPLAELLPGPAVARARDAAPGAGGP